MHYILPSKPDSKSFIESVGIFKLLLGVKGSLNLRELSTAENLSSGDIANITLQILTFTKQLLREMLED